MTLNWQYTSFVKIWYSFETSCTKKCSLRIWESSFRLYTLPIVGDVRDQI